MILRSLLAYGFVFAALLLISCGGGSTVTTASLTPESSQVDVGGRTVITAEADNSIANPMGEKVTFTIRHNESGSRLDIINDRLDGGGGDQKPKAQAIFFAGPRQGVDIVEASFASGARATTTIRVGEGVVLGDIRLEAFSQADPGPSGAWRIRATVTDTRGFAAVGVNVGFSTNHGTLSSPGGLTNQAGQVESVLSGLAPDRGARVWATSGGITTSIDVGGRGGEDVHSIVLEQFATRVRATVMDRAGRPVQDVLVNFGISKGNISQTVTTNVNGIAEATVTNLDPGDTATVTANVGSVSRAFTYTHP